MNLATLIEKHEGRRRWPYLDTKGPYTIGVGRNLTYDGLRDDEIDLMLANDIEEIQTELEKRDWYLPLKQAGASQEIRRYALIDMGMMGVAKLDKFVHMIAAIRAKDWDTAAKEILNSQWAKDVKDTRAHDVSEMMRTGNWPD